MPKKRPSLSAVHQREVQEAAQREAQPATPAQQDESQPQRQAPVYGKRADPAYTQLSATIPKDLKARFKAAVVMDGRDINTVVEELLEAYLKGR